MVTSSRIFALRTLLMAATSLGAATLACSTAAAEQAQNVPSSGSSANADYPAASGSRMVSVAAQDAADAKTSKRADVDVTDDAEMVVTARRQEESLQDVPVNVTAYTADSLTKLGIKSLTDLSLATPGFSYANIGQRSGNRITMRGLGVSTTGSSKSSFFLDGVFIAGDFTGLSLAALSRSEILKGPQSAVFGRTTFAGAINYVTRDPGNELEGGAAIDVATFGEVRADAWVAAPIIADKLSGLLSVSYVNYEAPDAWQDATDQSRHGSQQSTAFLGKLVFKPSEAVTLRALASYNKSDDGPANVLFIDPAARNGTIAKINPITGQPTGGIARYPIGLVPTFQPRTGDFAYFQDYLNNVGERIHQWRTYLQLDAEVFGDHALTITGAHNKQQNANENNGSIRGRPPSGYVFNSYSFSTTADDSLEVRFSSPQQQSFRYAFGAYYLDIRQRPGDGGTNVAYFVSPTPAGDLVQAGASGLNRNTNMSVFGALYIDPVENLTISLEGRYQQERIIREGFNAGTITLATYRSGGTSPAIPILAPDGSQFRKTFKSFLPRVNLQYHFSDAFNVYATYSKGNNPGGFNTAQYASADQLIIGEEELLNYEVGTKIRLGRTLSIDFAAYRMDWKNQQTTGTFFSPTNVPYSIVENRGKSRIHGVDLDMNWRTPIEGFDIRAAIGYNDGKYRDYCSTNLAALLYTLPTNATPAERIQFACVPVGGNQLESVSKWQASISLNLTRPITDVWEGFIRADYQYASAQFDSEFNYAKSAPVNVINARVGLQSDAYSLEMFVRNLTNEASPTRLSRASDSFAGANNTTNQSIAFVTRLPRSFGVRAAVRFK